MKFKGCHVPSGMCSPTTTAVCCLTGCHIRSAMDRGVPFRVLAAPGVPAVCPDGWKSLEPFPLDAHTDTGGGELPVLPWPLGGTRTQTLPQDKDQCLGKQSSVKSLLSTFHCRNNRAVVTLDASAEQTESRAATCPQLLPALCPARMGHQEAKSQLRGPMASAAMGAAAPGAHRDSPAPHAVAGSRAGTFGTFKSTSARLVFFCLQQEQRRSLHAGTCRLLFSQLSGWAQKDQTAKLTNWRQKSGKAALGAGQHMGQLGSRAADPVQTLSCHPHHELQPDIPTHKTRLQLYLSPHYGGVTVHPNPSPSPTTPGTLSCPSSHQSSAGQPCVQGTKQVQCQQGLAV